MGKKAGDGPVDGAWEHVLGCARADNVRAENLNHEDRSGAGRAKILDTFCALGRVITARAAGNDLLICEANWRPTRTVIADFEDDTEDAGDRLLHVRQDLAARGRHPVRHA